MRNNPMTTNSKLPRAKDTPAFDYEGLSPREKESFKVYHMMLAQISRQYINIGGKVLDRKIVEQLEREGKLPE